MSTRRDLSKKISQMAKKFPVIGLTGPRQSGKTTLCKQLFTNYDYVTLENPDNKQFALEDPKGFLNQYNKKVIIDEVQNAPELFSYIQGIVDEKKQNGQFILTGSQNFLLLEKISQSLAGRIYISHLLPFSQQELKITKKDSLYKTIFYGGYPRIFDQQIKPTDFFPSYVNTYVERDVRSIVNIQNTQKFISFIKICAGRTGQLFKAASIANELDIDSTTIARWINLLEASFICFRLQPWHENFNKRITKTPKLYFYDTGLACYLLGINAPTDLQIHFAKGALFENYIIVEHLKHLWNQGKPFNSYYWQDKSYNEIDLLHVQGQQLDIAEIKVGETYKSDFAKQLHRFEKLAAEKYSISKKIIYGGQIAQNRTNLSVRPWYDFL